MPAETLLSPVCGSGIIEKAASHQKKVSLSVHEPVHEQHGNDMTRRVIGECTRPRNTAPSLARRSYYDAWFISVMRVAYLYAFTKREADVTFLCSLLTLPR